jgi:predicted short-subunit dehydrogenase-like oxidoreductase (DUF2520 family)
VSEPRSPSHRAIVGNGRMGRALAAALPDWDGPFGRGFDGTDGDGHEYDVVLLAVPDAQIGAAAAAIRPGHLGRLVGHTAGSIGLAPLAPHECFAIHPLMTVPLTGADFTGAGAAIAGSSPEALATARQLAEHLGMHCVEIADVDRAAYHAAASIASNFLVALEDAAETILATTGADRAILIPLVRASLENWAIHGGPTALTGPIARGDDATVARQRSAVADRAPELLEMFDSMCAVTRALARRRGAP